MSDRGIILPGPWFGAKPVTTELVEVTLRTRVPNARASFLFQFWDFRLNLSSHALCCCVPRHVENYTGGLQLH